MGKMKDLWAERQEIEQEIAIARMEAEMEALPESYAESLEINRSLRTQLGALAEKFESANSPKEKNKERAIGFALGVLASLVAALICWELSKF
jgi:hypothetical protein